MPRLAALRSFVRPPWPLLFALAGAGLILFARSEAHVALPAFCGAGTARLLSALSWSDALDLVLALNPPGRLLADWAVMLLAMMPPLLAVPLMHVWRSSLPRGRVRAVVCFVLGYCLVWMMMGPILIVLALLLQLMVADGALAFSAALLGAIVWGASPWHRAALNRGHRLGRIGLFGWGACRDCLSFATSHAAWCVSSCWVWMLAVLTAGAWHVPTMVIVGAIMLSERLSAPERPRWRLPPPVALLDLRSSLTMPQSMVRHG